MHKALNKRKLLGYFSSRAAGPMAHATIFFCVFYNVFKIFLSVFISKNLRFSFLFPFRKRCEEWLCFLSANRCCCYIVRRERERVTCVFRVQFSPKNFSCFCCMHIYSGCVFCSAVSHELPKKRVQQKSSEAKKNVSISAFRWAFIFVVGPLRVVE